MTIDELAREAGVTTRNIRAYQAKGLLPPPILQGRVGHYDERHLTRLRLVARLQREGFSLAGVAELLRAWEEGRGLADVLGLEEELIGAWSSAQPQVMTAEELAALFPNASGEELRAFVELGFVVPLDDGRFRVPSAQMLELGAALTRLGVPVSASLDVARKLRVRAEDLASDFSELFQRHVWEPFVDAGMPAERMAEITRSLHLLRPLAFDAVTFSFATAMDRLSEDVTAGRLVPEAAARKGAKPPRAAKPARRRRTR
jgi:DNA-binding transcriptional MerR regulator